MWIVLASQLCACAAGAPRAASVRGAHVPAAPLLQSVLSRSKLNSVPPRHFDISALLSHSPGQRCACSGFGGTCGSGGMGQRQRREGSCEAAWQLGACVRHPRKVLNDPHVDSHPRLFSKPVRENNLQIFIHRAEAARRRGVRNSPWMRAHSLPVRPRLPHLQRENHQLGQELQHVCSAAGLRVCSGVIKFLAKRLSVRWG